MEGKFRFRLSLDQISYLIGFGKKKSQTQFKFIIQSDANIVRIGSKFRIEPSLCLFHENLMGCCCFVSLNISISPSIRPTTFEFYVYDYFMFNSSNNNNADHHRRQNANKEAKRHHYHHARNDATH